MSEIERALYALADRVDYPEPPDFVGPVVRAIAGSQSPRGRRAQIAITLATIIVVVALIPAAREQVTAWLGLRGVTIVESPLDPPLDWTGHIDLGDPMTLVEAAQRAGFEPLIPSSLGAPDAVYVENQRIWLVYATRPDLPETSLPGIGAVITQLETGDMASIVKRAGSVGVEYVELEAAIGAWIQGPHDLVLIDPSDGSSDGRLADNTLLFETETLTLRIEIAGSLSAAVEIASSMR